MQTPDTRITRVAAEAAKQAAKAEQDRIDLIVKVILRAEGGRPITQEEIQKHGRWKRLPNGTEYFYWRGVLAVTTWLSSSGEYRETGIQARINYPFTDEDISIKWR